MLPPLSRRSQRETAARSKERGFTLALVTVSLVAIIAMAALSIDIGTLYQAKAEAQRAADAGALTGARVISISGITGDPTNGSGSWAAICGGATSPASLAAINVGQQDLIGGVAGSITVKYGAGGAGTFTPDCTAAGPNFGVNPVVKVTAQRTNLPIFFARVFSLFGSNFAGTSVSATASAEVYNPSGSSLLASGMIPVQPRCVKPLIVANYDPGNGGNLLVNSNGTIVNPGINQLGGGVIGETFTVRVDCGPAIPNCNPPTPPTGNMRDNPPSGTLSGSPGGATVDYIPALVSGNPGAVPACSTASAFQQAMGGCDQTTVYSCGVSAVATQTQADMTINPGSGIGGSGDTATAAQCLIHSTSGGQDTLAGGTTPTFPFQIQAGGDNPLAKDSLVNSGDTITSSSSIVTLPIGYFGAGLVTGVNQPFVTIGGYLQVFVQSIDANGDLVVTALNVAGCGNTVPGGATYITGTSPVPVRLITPP
jgi:Flp pilus assembly protein TadG